MGTDEGSLGIMFCLHRFPFGGGIVNPIETAAGLRAQGHRVWLFYLDDPAGSGPDETPWALSRRPALELARARGVPVLFAERPAGRRAPAALRRLTRLLAEHRIDVVHSFGDTALTRWMLVAGG